MSYANNPTKDFYIDAYWILKIVVERIAKNPFNAQKECQQALQKIKELRKK